MLSLACAWQTATAQPVYICQLDGKAVYTSYPAKLGHKARCAASALSPAASDPIATETAAASEPESDPISQLWYDLEFGRINEHIPIEPRLPAPPPPKTPLAVNPTAASPSTSPPKLTPRQLVARDIAAEEHALNRARTQWQQARQRQRFDEAATLMRAIGDREQNIRALKEELRRFAPR